MSHARDVSGDDRLAAMTALARGVEPAFDVKRSLSGALARREARARRAQQGRRVAVLASGASLLALLVLRGPFAPSAASASGPAVSAPPEAPRVELAVHALDDGGFARD